MLDSTLSLPGMSYTLTEDTVALRPDDVIITVHLGPNDQSELEGLSEVATDTNNTFIVFSEGAIKYKWESSGCSYNA